MSSMDSMRLQSLIRLLRQCKTSEEERSTVKVVTAQLRKGFSDATPYIRVRYMLMLLYIRMLGYPTEFGHMEVLKLLSQADFSGARIGYLALQLLFSEGDEVLPLVENRMIAHLNVTKLERGITQDRFCVIGTALNAAANIASEDMCRDLLDSILQVFQSCPPHLRSKAALAALRVVRKAPDQGGYILEHCTDLFENNTDSLMCVLTLVIECLQTSSGREMIGTFRKAATSAVRCLKSLVLSPRISDEDVNGITDPFLQVKLLHFMRIIGTGSDVTSEALNDVLAQVITNTDATRNVGSAVLYECVRTVHAIESDEGLRTLAVNTIGRFLSSVKDNNLRLVALQTLLTYADRDFHAVVQHQATILECLRDPDIAIRRRALDLTVTLITTTNVRLLVPDLIVYMSLCDDSMRSDVARHISNVIDTHFPSDIWRVDYSIRLLKASRQHAPMDFAGRLLVVISNLTKEVQTRTVEALWEEASYPFDALHQSRKALMMVTLWSLGEYLELLLGARKGLTGAEVATCVSGLTTNTDSTLLKQYGLTALMKIATKCSDARPQALSAFASNTTSMDCELQQRACEYVTLLTDFPQEAAFCFSQMPPIAPAKQDVKPVEVVTLTQAELQHDVAHTLDDLFNFDGASRPAAQDTERLTSTDSPLFQTSVPPLADDVSVAKVHPVSSPGSPIDDLFHGEAAQPSSDAAAMLPGTASLRTACLPVDALDGPSGICVYSCPDMKVLLSGRMIGVNVVADLVVQSCVSATIDQLTFSIAVLKMCSIEMAPVPPTVTPFGTVTQHLTVDNSRNATNPRTLTLRVKISYTIHNEPREQLFHVAQVF